VTNDVEKRLKSASWLRLCTFFVLLVVMLLCDNFSRMPQWAWITVLHLNRAADCCSALLARRTVPNIFLTVNAGQSSLMMFHGES
jgi:hypothetical protein